MSTVNKELFVVYYINFQFYNVKFQVLQVKIPVLRISPYNIYLSVFVTIDVSEKSRARDSFKAARETY